MKDKILDILEEFQVNEENQEGVKGNVIWDIDFDVIVTRLEKLFELHLVSNNEVAVDCFTCKYSMRSIEDEPCNTCSENLSNYEAID